MLSNELDLFVVVAFWLGIALLAITLGLVVATLWVQSAIEAGARRRALIFSTWTDRLAGRDGVTQLPRPPDARDAFAVLCAWCDLVGDDSSGADWDRLRRIAYESELDRIARRFLHGKDPAAKIAGARALGYLGEGSESAALLALTSAPDRDLAEAARASLGAISGARPKKLRGA